MKVLTSNNRPPLLAYKSSPGCTMHASSMLAIPCTWMFVCLHFVCTALIAAVDKPRYIPHRTDASSNWAQLVRDVCLSKGGLGLSKGGFVINF